MSAVEWVSDTMRRYKGVSFPWRGIEDMEAQMAAIDRAEANKGGSMTLHGDRLSHPDNWRELKATKVDGDPRTERELTTWIVAKCDELGWMVCHFRPGQVKGADGSVDYRTPIEGDAGFPDIVALRGDRMVIAELKHTSKVKAEQELWLEAFRQAGAEVYVWHPSDLEAIEEVLA